MTILVDTCVLIDMVEADGEWSVWSATQLGTWRARGPLLINPMVFAEWSALFPRVAAVEAAMVSHGLTWRDIPRQALFLAAQAHTAYRRRGGAKAMVLPDFLIGAHAAVARLPVLTRDRRRFVQAFAGLQVIHPGLSSH